MNINEFLPKCKELVAEYTNEHMDPENDQLLSHEDVYIVWHSKTLQHSKALLSTSLPDRMYYEITYNGDKKEFYFDAYMKMDNIVVIPGEVE